MNYISCTVPIYCPDNYVYIVILFKNNEVFKFGATSNLTDWITRQKKYVDTEDISSYSSGYIFNRNNGLIKDVISAISLLYGKNYAMISDDSKVFIYGRTLYKYVGAVHNLSRSMLNGFLKCNPDITTYFNMGNIVYLKQEIDNKVISDAKRGLFRK